MEFVSTRGLSEPVGFADAVAQGLAPDGGLYLPRDFPDLSGRLEAWQSLDYPKVEFNHNSAMLALSEGESGPKSGKADTVVHVDIIRWWTWAQSGRSS